MYPRTSSSLHVWGLSFSFPFFSVSCIFAFLCTNFVRLVACMFMSAPYFPLFLHTVQQTTKFGYWCMIWFVLRFVKLLISQRIKTKELLCVQILWHNKNRTRQFEEFSFSTKNETFCYKIMENYSDYNKLVHVCTYTPLFTNYFGNYFFILYCLFQPIIQIIRADYKLVIIIIKM